MTLREFNDDCARARNDKRPCVYKGSVVARRCGIPRAMVERVATNHIFSTGQFDNVVVHTNRGTFSSRQDKASRDEMNAKSPTKNGTKDEVAH